MLRRWLTTHIQRLAPVCALLVLAPWVGEYLLGNISARYVLGIPFLIPMYGGGALLVREIARRTGRGWPTIVLLGAAYGIIEAGLVDQSMFNPTFMGWEFQAVTPIPALGISAWNTVTFVAGHAIWSIGIPIAVVEMLTPQRRTTPWLGNVGLAITTLLYALGCLIIYQDVATSEGFHATTAQRIGALIATIVCITLAFTFRPQSIDDTKQISVPSPWLLGIGAFIVSGIYAARPENWFGFWFGLVILGVAALLAARWTRQPTWTIRHHHALVGGVLLTYAWLGFVLTSMTVPDDLVAWMGNVVFAVLAVALVAYTAHFLRQRDSRVF